MISYIVTILVLVAIAVALFQLTIGTDQSFAAIPKPASVFQPNGLALTIQDNDDLIAAAKAPPKIRVEALLRLTEDRFPLEKIVPIMARATSDRDELVRAAGEVGIARIGKSAMPVLITMMDKNYLESKDFIAVCGAASVLGPDAIELFPKLQEALDSGESKYQKMALFAMKNMGDENIKAMDRLIELLDSVDLNAQIAVCKILESLGPNAEPATEKLVDLFEHGIVSTRSWAAIVLGAIGESMDHDILALLTKRLDAFVLVDKQRAMIGLGHMGANAQPAVEKITQLMNDPSKNCQPQAAVTRWQITGEIEPSLKVLGELLPTRDYKQTVLEQLANIGPAAAPMANTISKELASDDVSIRELAAIALGKIGPAAQSAMPQLKALLQDKDALLRQAVTDAIAAIEKEPKTQ